jgi:hypothetical protein
MVRWNARTEHVKRPSGKRLTPARPRIEILEDGDQFLPFACQDRLRFAKVCKALAERSVRLTRLYMEVIL